MSAIFDKLTLNTFSIFPLKGSIACNSLFRACFAEPPALSPSTINNSVPSIFLLEQSTNFPGSLCRSLNDFLSISLILVKSVLSKDLSIRFSIKVFVIFLFELSHNKNSF